MTSLLLRAVRRSALVLMLLSSSAPAGARELLRGPVPAEVMEVIDGDTVRVRAHIWLGQAVETSVRLDGIDTPELRGDCDGERRLARAARDYLVGLVAGRRVSLRDITQDKYGGRVVARMDDHKGRDLGAALISAGYARAYDGGTRGTWC